MKPISIAIDGYSSCGKSTLAKALAQKLEFIYIDTGAMYRAVTLFALRNGLFSNGKLMKEGLIKKLPQIVVSFRYNSADQKADTYLNGENVEAEIRTMEVSSKVSFVSEVKEVRQKLVQLQQQMAEEGGVVMDGRDIGTVVMPGAELKIFMTADKAVRAGRRFMELQEKGVEATLEEVKRNIEERDYIDTHRDESPLTRAADARVLDNSNLTPQQQLDIAMEWAGWVQPGK